jgi:hypothetical protein
VRNQLVVVGQQGLNGFIDGIPLQLERRSHRESCCQRVLANPTGFIAEILKAFAHGTALCLHITWLNDRRSSALSRARIYFLSGADASPLGSA